MDGSGAVVVRPYNLGYRADFGFSAVFEPEDMELLLQLVISEGCGPY